MLRKASNERRGLSSALGRRHTNEGLATATRSLRSLLIANQPEAGDEGSPATNLGKRSTDLLLDYDLISDIQHEKESTMCGEISSQQLLAHSK